MGFGNITFRTVCVIINFSIILVYITSIIEKLIITHKEPIEGIKAWILLGYPSNIFGYPRKY